MFSARTTPYLTFGGFAVLAAALTASACGGKAVIDSAGAVGATSNQGGANQGGANQGGSASVGASGAGAHPGGANAGFGGASPVLDAGAPTAGTVGSLSGCVDAHFCSLTPADIACNVDSDCSELEAPGCGEVSVIGINQHSRASCVAAPCAIVPGDAGCPECPVYHGEDCSQVQTIKDLLLHCVAHVCLSYFPCLNCIEY